MDVAVVYESMFGTTGEVAQALAEGVRGAAPGLSVTVLPVTQAGPEAVRGASLLLVGGPTHSLGMSRASSRRQALAPRKGAPPSPAEQAASTGTALGVRDWLDALPTATPGALAAAFDTRMGYPLAGGAAPRIARRLRRHGYVLADRPRAFVVQGARGPLRAGEREKARKWAAALALQVAGSDAR